MSEAKRLIRRAKKSERSGASWFIEHDGPDLPPMNPGGGIVTVTGRVGHIYDLQYDGHSLHYASENKNVKLNATWVEWWTKIIERAAAAGKQPCLRIDPSNKPGRVPVMHIITEDRHRWLLECERRATSQP